MRMSHDSQYCIKSWFVSNGLPLGDIMEYAKIKDVDFDILLDTHGVDTGMKLLIKHYNFWYHRLATRLEKTRIFYKLLAQLNDELEDIYIELPAHFKKQKLKMDKRKNILAIIDDAVESGEGIPDFDPEGRHVDSSIVNFKKFVTNLMKKLSVYSKHIYYSLDHVMRTEYKAGLQSGLINVGNISSTYTSGTDYYLTVDSGTGSSLTSINTFNTVTGTVSGSTNITVNNSTNRAIRVVNNTTSTINVVGNPYFDGQLVSEYKPPKIDFRKKKKERKKTRNVIKKSLNGLKKFLPYDKILAFVNGGQFEITGPKYKWIIKKKDHYGIEKYSRILDSFHIPYELKVYTHQNEFLADLCVTFKGCPILDQILSTLLHIKSGDEDGLLYNCNFNRPSEMGKELRDRIHGKNKFNSSINADLDGLTLNVDSLTATGSVYAEGSGTLVSGSTNDSVRNPVNETVTGTMAVISTDIMRMMQKKYKNEKIEKANKEFVKRELDKFWKFLLGDAIYEFVRDRHVTWDELNDYYMMPDYSYDVLDYLVKGKGIKNNAPRLLSN